MRGEDAGPEVEGVGVLPVVDLLVAVFGWVSDALAEVHGKLPDVDETGGVAYVCIETPELGSAILHEVDGGEGERVGEARAFDETLVCGFKDGGADGGIGDDGEAPDEEEGGDAG